MKEDVRMYGFKMKISPGSKALNKVELDMILAVLKRFIPVVSEAFYGRAGCEAEYRAWDEWRHEVLEKTERAPGAFF